MSTISATPEQLLNIARLQLHADDPNAAAFEAFLEYLRENVLHSPDIRINDVSDFLESLTTITAGIHVIEDCHHSGADVEEPLTDEVGWYYAEPLDKMVDEARAKSPKPDSVYEYLREKIDQLTEALQSD